MSMMNLATALTRLVAPLIIAPLLSTAAIAAETPLRVVATFSILADMAREVGGDKVTVTSLVAPGGDAHVYQPTPSDAKTVAAANLVIVNGLGMEGWFDRLVAVSASKARIVVASDGITPLTMTAEEGAKSGATVTDPHAWQDLANGRQYVTNIVAGMIASDPADAAYFQSRAIAYTNRLAVLDSWVREHIEAVPAKNRRIITSHDAFGYFGHAYGVTFQAPVGISTEADPSAAQIGALIRQIKREHTKALFIETMTDPRLIETLAKESGAVVGPAIYSDSLSPAGGPADTYEKMFRHNVPLFAAAMMKN